MRCKCCNKIFNPSTNDKFKSGLEESCDECLNFINTLGYSRFNHLRWTTLNGQQDDSKKEVFNYG